MEEKLKKIVEEFIWQSDSMQKLPKSLNMNTRYEIRGADG